MREGWRAGEGASDRRRILALGDLLARVLGHRVELVTPESLSPFLRPHILADAAKKVPVELRGAHPQVQWRSMARKIPVLREQLRRILGAS